MADSAKADTTYPQITPHGPPSPGACEEDPGARGGARDYADPPGRLLGPVTEPLLGCDGRPKEPHIEVVDQHRRGAGGGALGTSQFGKPRAILISLITSKRCLVRKRTVRSPPLRNTRRRGCSFRLSQVKISTSGAWAAWNGSISSLMLYVRALFQNTDSTMDTAQDNSGATEQRCFSSFHTFRIAVRWSALRRISRSICMYTQVLKTGSYLAPVMPHSPLRFA